MPVQSRCWPNHQSHPLLGWFSGFGHAQARSMCCLLSNYFLKFVKIKIGFPSRNPPTGTSKHARAVPVLAKSSIHLAVKFHLPSVVGGMKWQQVTVRRRSWLEDFASSEISRKNSALLTPRLPLPHHLDPPSHLLFAFLSFSPSR
jgi:hypothetical protein